MKKTFTVECTMEERWMNHFISFLKYIEYCGKIGHSEPVVFYCDGDGDFRPKFKLFRPYKRVFPRVKNFDRMLKVFDAG